MNLWYYHSPNDRMSSFPTFVQYFHIAFKCVQFRFLMFKMNDTQRRKKRFRKCAQRPEVHTPKKEGHAFLYPYRDAHVCRCSWDALLVYFWGRALPSDRFYRGSRSLINRKFFIQPVFKSKIERGGENGPIRSVGFLSHISADQSRASIPFLG